jgi:ElaB/YqjD/DUF883 family membrane-anchored ribosome-binding protein
MANNGYNSSAELEREVEAQRAQVESTIGEIKERLTPGQLVDEMLSYTKHGGAHFAANLGNTVTANPLPVALIGIGIAWLMSGQKPQTGTSYTPNHAYGFDGRAHGSMEPVYGSIKGSSLRRTAHTRDEAGNWYSDFADDAGSTYRAKSNELGHRAGHFIDNAGKSVSGFIDDTGRRVSSFRDEAGNALEEAGGWANHAWNDARDAIGQQAGAMMDQAGNALHQVQQTAADMQQNAARMSRDAMRMLEDQPLVMGALAFAAGAALGATLPHTEQEDQLMGEAADSVKREAGHVAADLYEQGKEKAGELYEEVSDKAGEIYGDAKAKLGATEQQPATGQSTRH